MGWVDADQVQAITGREVSPESLALAQTMIEIFAGTTELASDSELIATRNLRHLRSAVAFQAVWLDTHPDVLDTMDVQGISQDRVNAQYSRANAHLLAPMASRCIDRLSWRAQIRIGRGNWSRRHLPDVGNRSSAVHDDQYEWSPLPFGAAPVREQR